MNFIPHGYCLLWQPGLLFLHVASDTLIAVAYYTIPFALLYFVRKRRDLPLRGLFVLSGLFILGCGTTHVMGVWTLWQPQYWADGAIKGLTAVVSIGTACAMWLAMPQALALPSTQQLEAANARLQHEICERNRAEQALRNVNHELEWRVAQRESDLEIARNALLRVVQLGAVEELTTSIAQEIRSKHIAVEAVLARIETTTRESVVALFDEMRLSRERLGRVENRLRSLERAQRLGRTFHEDQGTIDYDDAGGGDPH